VYKDLDERELAKACSSGERMAEDELYRRYAARVYTLCRRYSDDADEAKDLMQDALIRALDKIHTFTFTGKGSLYGWISRIAINLSLNHIKRRLRRTTPLDFSRADNIPEPAEEEMERISEEKLLEMISRLPRLRRTVFNLYCIEGYSHKEIGKALGISEKGSASALAKAKRQLKEEINLYMRNLE